MISEMRRRKFEPALLPTQRMFNLPYHLGMVWEELTFDDPGFETDDLLKWKAVAKSHLLFKSCLFKNAWLGSDKYINAYLITLIYAGYETHDLIKWKAVSKTHLLFKSCPVRNARLGSKYC